MNINFKLWLKGFKTFFKNTLPLTFKDLLHNDRKEINNMSNNTEIIEVSDEETHSLLLISEGNTRNASLKRKNTASFEDRIMATTRFEELNCFERAKRRKVKINDSKEADIKLADILEIKELGSSKPESVPLIDNYSEKAVQASTVLDSEDLDEVVNNFIAACNNPVVLDSIIENFKNLTPAEYEILSSF